MRPFFKRKSENIIMNGNKNKGKKKFILKYSESDNYLSGSDIEFNFEELIDDHRFPKNNTNHYISSELDNINNNTNLSSSNKLKQVVNNGKKKENQNYLSSSSDDIREYILSNKR